MKTCSRCNIKKLLTEFPRHRRMPLGVYSCCKACKALEARESRARHPEAVRLRNQQRDPEMKARYWKRWYAEHGPREGRRYADVRQATPSWADRFLLAEAYRLARLRTKILGYPWEVDHVVPIKHREVCGLHVPANLRVVPRAVNRQKGNRIGR